MPLTLMLAAALALAGCGGGSNTTGGAGSGGSSTGTGGSGSNPNLAKFSFFVTSVEAIQRVAGSNAGLGGDLRHGETGAGAGLRGADKICSEIAETAMPGAGSKAWRAFLSAAAGGTGGAAVHAKDRIGAGPWYDAKGRQVASTLAQLLMERPGDADPAIKNDLPNELGIPNGSTGANNHAILTGTGPDGMLYSVVTPTTDSTCSDWTSKEMTGKPWFGHSWPRQGSGANWMSAASASGCAPCVSTGTACVGSTGGYGGFYCFVAN